MRMVIFYSFSAALDHSTLLLSSYILATEPVAEMALAFNASLPNPNPTPSSQDELLSPNSPFSKPLSFVWIMSL